MLLGMLMMLFMMLNVYNKDNLTQEELEANRHAADAVYDAARDAALDADWAAYADAAYDAYDAYSAASDAYAAELKKTQKETSND